MSTVELGINGATVPKAGLKEIIPIASNAGFHFVEPRQHQAEECIVSGTEAEVKHLLHLNGMSWLPLNALEGLFELDADELERRAKKLFSLANALGIPNIVVVPGVKTTKDVSLKVAKTSLSWLKSLAEDFGVDVVYEYIGFNTHYLSDFNKAIQLCQAADCKLVLDTFHLAISETPLPLIEALPADLIALVHLSDALVLESDPSQASDEDRVLPGEGHLPLKGILRAIKSTEYNGPVSIEVFHPKYTTRKLRDVAEEAYRRAKSTLQGSGWYEGGCS